MFSRIQCPNTYKHITRPSCGSTFTVTFYAKKRIKAAIKLRPQMAALEPQEDGAMIEPAQKRHREEIASVIRAAVTECVDAGDQDLRNIIDDSISSSNAFLEEKHKGVHLVHLDSGRVVGLILVHEFWNMKSLYVLPDFHNKGIAAGLVSKALAVCRAERPCGSVKLNSSTYASSFYDKLGFKKNGNPRDLSGGCVPYVYSF